MRQALVQRIGFELLVHTATVLTQLKLRVGTMEPDASGTRCWHAIRQVCVGNRIGCERGAAGLDVIQATAAVRCAACLPTGLDSRAEQQIVCQTLPHWRQGPGLRMALQIQQWKVAIAMDR